MRSKKLTSRQKQIIEMLISLNRGKPVTVAEIAKYLDVSTRTVLRELPSIEEWFYENDFIFTKKPGVGLLIDETEENKELILELLEVENIVKTYSKEERKRIILYELINDKEPLKLIYFISRLKVSEGTLTNDLDELEEWLGKYKINLIRKPGVGIYLEGDEESYRKVLSELLHTTIDNDSIIHLLKHPDEKPNEFKYIKKNILEFLDVKTLRIIQQVLVEVEENKKLNLGDSTYIRLVIHLTLTFQRIQQGEKIKMDSKVLAELEALPEFELAKLICEHLSISTGTSISKDEMAYITMHIKGTKLALRKFEKEDDFLNDNMMDWIDYFISEVEDELGIKLYQKEKLRTDLLNHLIPAINRLRMKLTIRNLFLDRIKEKYGEIYKACEKACEILKNITNIDIIPEAEIAYITMHFAAAIQNEVIRVVIACPVGIGTSKLLATNLEKNFKNIEVVGHISAINIDEKLLYEKEVGCIISTVALEDISFPYICLSPFLPDEDRQKLNNFINERMYKKNRPSTVVNKKDSLEREHIQHISDYGTTILTLLSNFKCKQLREAKDIGEIIKEASALFTLDNKEQKLIEEGLIARENLMTTYLPKYNMMFLHCKTAGTKECRFGVIQLEKELSIEDKTIEAAVVALVPEERLKLDLEIMSYLNGEIIGDQLLREVIKKERAQEIEVQIENKLKTLYRQYLTKALEG